jgi:hypothetical protein
MRPVARSRLGCESDSLPVATQHTRIGSAAVDVRELATRNPDFIRRCFSRESAEHQLPQTFGPKLAQAHALLASRGRALMLRFS